MQADLSVLQFEFQWNGATTKEHTAIQPKENYSWGLECQELRRFYTGGFA